MKKIMQAALLVMVAISFNFADASAASNDKYKPFVLASNGVGTMAASVAEVSAKL